uniref:Integrase core domain containing protein n=1 Tax=Solanum tuberosum TaxID=4113 RepID=M1DHX7_SOLTU
MAKSPSKYTEETVQEFYASYTATVQNTMPPRAKSLAQPPLQDKLLWGFSMDISDTTICHFIYDPAHTLPINTLEYDYRIRIVQSRSFQKDADQRESLLKWMARHIADDGEGTKWDVPEPTTKVEADDLELSELFGDEMPPLIPPRTTGKLTRSSEPTSDIDEARRAKKREWQQLEAAQQQSRFEEELRLQRAHEMAGGAYGSRATTDGGPTIVEGATEGVTIGDPAGSGKLNPPTS